MPGLILNTAEKRVQFVIYDQDGLLCAQDWQAGRSGTELLIPALEQALRGLGKTAGDLTKIACVRGPGNFTGIRLGLATSAGLARATGAEQAGLNYLDCLACNLPAQPGQPAAILVSARQGWYFLGRYQYDQALLPHALADVALVPAHLADLRLDCDFALGSALEQMPDLAKQVVACGCRILPASFNTPSPEALLRAANALDPAAYVAQDPEPMYLRECDAVENLEQIALGLGLDPDHALRDLHALRRVQPS